MSSITNRLKHWFTSYFDSISNKKIQCFLSLYACGVLATLLLWGSCKGVVTLLHAMFI